MKLFITLILKFYQLTLSPIFRVLFGPGCRYPVNCSQYAVNVIERYGVIKGGALAVKRLSTCHI